VDPPVGTLLAGGNALSARGMTSDGYEIYSDDAALQLYAVPIAGGATQSIGALGSNFWVTVVGQVVFAWSNVTDADVGALTIWTAAHGSQAISSASFGILGSASPDGSQVLYVANVDPQGLTGDVYVAGTDGAGATRLLQGQQLTGCFPQLGFAGAFAVVSHCDVARGRWPFDDGILVPRAGVGAGGPHQQRSKMSGRRTRPGRWCSCRPATASSWLRSAEARPRRSTPRASWGSSSQEERPPSTARPRARFDALRPRRRPPRRSRQAFGGFYAISPAQSTVLYYQNDTATGSDVFLASAITPGTPRTISAVMNGAVNGDAFTADSTYALYSTSNDVCTGSSTFNAFPVNGSSSTVLGRSVWGDWSATGAKVIFNDNYVATGGLRFGRADIESVNLAAGTTPARVVSQADAVLDLSPAGDQVIYSWTVTPGPLAGIYVTPVP
jgi:hypothetical protein